MTPAEILQELALAMARYAAGLPPRDANEERRFASFRRADEAFAHLEAVMAEEAAKTPEQRASERAEWVRANIAPDFYRAEDWG